MAASTSACESPFFSLGRTEPHSLHRRCIQAMQNEWSMILRKRVADKDGEPQPAWKAFAEVQQSDRETVGYVSQPAHAALAGQLARALNDKLFGTLTPQVLDAISRHDAGWTRADLSALGDNGTTRPVSFLSVPAESAVPVWRQSIEQAQERFPLEGILTSRHFCLLAPRDQHPAHEAFVREENARRIPLEDAAGVAPAELDRYTAALGFCDLVSLCLCSGMTGTFEIPIAHPADQAATLAPLIRFSVDDASLSFDHPVARAACNLTVDAWERIEGGEIRNTILTWRLI